MPLFSGRELPLIFQLTKGVFYSRIMIGGDVMGMHPLDQSGPRPGKSKRGFASMSEERQREIASKGGRSVPKDKRSFSQDRQLASAAGRKGGQVSGRTRSGE
jgi:general stress protein YciG